MFTIVLIEACIAIAKIPNVFEETLRQHCVIEVTRGETDVIVQQKQRVEVNDMIKIIVMPDTYLNLPTKYLIHDNIYLNKHKIRLQTF